MRINVVTFNDNERDAVEALLNELASGNRSPWARQGQLTIHRPYGDTQWTLSHIPLLAQGNVVAAAELARQYASAFDRPDFVIFYGCAGALDADNGESVFLIEDVNYLSLGSVDSDDNGGERIELKNKWLCFTDPPSGVDPLRPIRFPKVNGEAPNLTELSGLPSARVAATDKLIHVGASASPSPTSPGPPYPTYKEGKWTYGQALDHIATSGDDILIEMESYGVGTIADSLGILEHVIVLRVATDTLTDHGKEREDGRDPQAELLMDGRWILGHLLACLFLP